VDGAEFTDHLVGAREQRGRHGEAARPCGFEVHHKVEFSCLLGSLRTGSLVIDTEDILPELTSMNAAKVALP
jgi:hypothetical protein